MTSQDLAPRDPVGRSHYLGAVRDAWRNARAAHESRSDALILALRMFARDGHARGVPIASLLRSLDSLVRPEPAELLGPDSDGFDAVRAWAGTEVIRAYYRAD